MKIKILIPIFVMLLLVGVVYSAAAEKKCDGTATLMNPAVAQQESKSPLGAAQTGASVLELTGANVPGLSQAMQGINMIGDPKTAIIGQLPGGGTIAQGIAIAGGPYTFALDQAKSFLIGKILAAAPVEAQQGIGKFQEAEAVVDNTGASLDHPDSFVDVNLCNGEMQYKDLQVNEKASDFYLCDKKEECQAFGNNVIVGKQCLEREGGKADGKCISNSVALTVNDENGNFRFCNTAENNAQKCSEFSGLAKGSTVIMETRKDPTTGKEVARLAEAHIVAGEKGANNIEVNGARYSNLPPGSGIDFKKQITDENGVVTQPSTMTIKNIKEPITMQIPDANGNYNKDSQQVKMSVANCEKDKDCIKMTGNSISPGSGLTYTSGSSLTLETSGVLITASPYSTESIKVDSNGFFVTGNGDFKTNGDFAFYHSKGNENTYVTPIKNFEAATKDPANKDKQVIAVQPTKDNNGMVNGAVSEIKNSGPGAFNVVTPKTGTALALDGPGEASVTDHCSFPCKCDFTASPDPGSTDTVTTPAGTKLVIQGQEVGGDTVTYGPAEPSPEQKKLVDTINAQTADVDKFLKENANPVVKATAGVDWNTEENKQYLGQPCTSDLPPEIVASCIGSPTAKKQYLAKTQSLEALNQQIQNMGNQAESTFASQQTGENGKAYCMADPPGQISLTPGACNAKPAVIGPEPELQPIVKPVPTAADAEMFDKYCYGYDELASFGMDMTIVASNQKCSGYKANKDRYEKQLAADGTTAARIKADEEILLSNAAAYKKAQALAGNTVSDEDALWAANNKGKVAEVLGTEKQLSENQQARGGIPIGEEAVSFPQVAQPADVEQAYNEVEKYKVQVYATGAAKYATVQPHYYDLIDWKDPANVAYIGQPCTESLPTAVFASCFNKDVQAKILDLQNNYEQIFSASDAAKANAAEALVSPKVVPPAPPTAIVQEMPEKPLVSECIGPFAPFCLISSSLL